MDGKRRRSARGGEVQRKNEREKGRTEANRREEGDAVRGLIRYFSVDGRPKRLFGRCLAEKAHFGRREAEVTIFGPASTDARFSAQLRVSSVNRGPKSPLRPIDISATTFHPYPGRRQKLPRTNGFHRAAVSASHCRRAPSPPPAAATRRPILPRPPRAVPTSHLPATRGSPASHLPATSRALASHLPTTSRGPASHLPPDEPSPRLPSPSDEPRPASPLRPMSQAPASQLLPSRRAPASQLPPSRCALTCRRSNRHEQEAIVTPSPVSTATSRCRARPPTTASTPVSRRCEPPPVAASKCGDLPAPRFGTGSSNESMSRRRSPGGRDGDVCMYTCVLEIGELIWWCVRAAAASSSGRSNSHPHSVQFINFIQFGEVEIGARWSVAVCVETARRNVTGWIPLFSDDLDLRLLLVSSCIQDDLDLLPLAVGTEGVVVT
ncbi:translation initiation factor IF-2-like [Triticum urartu]|uniref:translation initiation factor IF-2-like n=1 Tax=Triticum urartu TaxID=4572 RepID=UPI0020444F75|nr:translation initiation factor IF-2-like [Triticum urartu]